VTDKDEGVDLPTEFADGVRRYTKASQDIAQDAQRRTTEAAREYVRAVQDVLRQGQQVGGGDYQEAMRSFQSVAQDAQRRWQDAVRAYQDTVRAAADEIAQRQQAASRDYVASLQSAWTKVDPGTIDAVTIAAIQRAMVAAALTPQTVAS
jgi:4-hydroxy-L-threonine phosphate dehydrogenase PdxA